MLHDSEFTAKGLLLRIQGSRVGFNDRKRCRM